MTTGILERPAPQTGGPKGPEHPLPPDGGGDGPTPDPRGLLGDPTRFGLLAFLGTVSMLFIGFTSAFILRRASADWRSFTAPPALWLNTALLLTSSVTLEGARRRLRDWDLRGAQTFVAITGVLGLSFLLGQLLAWRQLAQSGLFLSTNPSSSFFYLLTGIHGLHLLGGLLWFAAIFVRVTRLALTPGQDGLRLFATYWHFLDALWLYLVLLLFVY